MAGRFSLQTATITFLLVVIGFLLLRDARFSPTVHELPPVHPEQHQRTAAHPHIRDDGNRVRAGVAPAKAPAASTGTRVDSATTTATLRAVAPKRTPKADGKPPALRDTGIRSSSTALHPAAAEGQQLPGAQDGDCRADASAAYPHSEDILKFTLTNSDATVTATRTGLHSYRIRGQHISLHQCGDKNVTAAKSAFTRCACHFQATEEGCMRSLEQSQADCSPDVRFHADLALYHPMEEGARNTPWRGQCCMVKRGTLRWTLDPSPHHVIGFSVTDAWMSQVHTLNGKVVSGAEGNDASTYRTLQALSCSNKKVRDNARPCAFKRDPGQSYATKGHGKPGMGGDLEVFPLTSSEEQCARLCCLLGAACSTYTWLTPGFKYGKPGIAGHCLYAAHGEKWFHENPMEPLEGAMTGKKRVSLSPDLSAWSSKGNDHGTVVPLNLDPCSADNNHDAMVAKQTKSLEQGAVPCANHYDCSVAGTHPVANTDAAPLWKKAKIFPAIGQCRGSRQLGTNPLELGKCSCEPPGIVHLDSQGQCVLRPGRCRTDEHCSPPIKGAVRGYCFNEAGELENSNSSPKYGICYCLRETVMTWTADGTVYCKAPAATVPGIPAGGTLCHDSANNAVAGPQQLAGTLQEQGGGVHTPRVCIFIGTAFEDAVTKTIWRGGRQVQLQFNFSARREVIQETWGNENTFLIWSKYLNVLPDAGPNARWKYKAINVDIAVDLPYERVAHRFFKVPEFLAEDYLAGGETASCDWMIMTDDDAYINIPQVERFFSNTPWLKPTDKWFLGPPQVIDFHKGAVAFAHGTSIIFSRAAISAFGTFAKDCYKYFDSPTGHTEHWGDTALAKCMLLYGMQAKRISLQWAIDNKHPDKAASHLAGNAVASRACVLAAHKFTVEGMYDFHVALTEYNRQIVERSPSKDPDQALRCELRKPTHWASQQCYSSHGAIVA